VPEPEKESEVHAVQIAERKAAAAIRVAEEAMKLLSDEQLAQLAQTVDTLEAGVNLEGDREGS